MLDINDQQLRMPHSSGGRNDDLKNGDVFAEIGKVLLACDQYAAAAEQFRKAITLGTSFEIFNLLAYALFPGPEYRCHLAALHERLNPLTYLEIGVFDGDTLTLAQPGTTAIGVDPMPCPASERAYRAPTKIFCQTSDAYFQAVFSNNTSNRPVIDLAFIDGLHHFDQVLRDFVNVERQCHRRSVVVLHDTLPIAALPAERNRTSSYWCGDVWKIIPCLRQYRPDLVIFTILTYPSGLTIVLGLDPNSVILANQFDKVVAKFIDLTLDAQNIDDLAVMQQPPILLQNNPAEVVSAIEVELVVQSRTVV